ncbi:MAG: TetR/AcrR family transcriptional regulator [Actinobacteria bacterium]|nr:TetR/AcrR family transcriptional regulator [Actinomycetota bacterium]
MTEARPARRPVGRPAKDAASIERMRDAIVAAATRRFAEHGVASTSIDDIAREAGVSRATVYRYAGGRDDVIVAVAMRRFDEWVEGVVGHCRKFAGAGPIVTEAIVWTSRTVGRDESLGALFAGGTAVAASQVLTRRAAAAATATFRRQFAELLAAQAGDLRPGLEPEVVADRVLAVVLERLARDPNASERALRDWVTTWLLPAVLDDRPPLPDPAAPGQPNEGKSR